MRKLLIVLALLASGSLAAAGNVWADNSAGGSIGTVQVGNTSLNASASSSTPAGDASVSAPTSVSGTGNNTASNSTGAIQVGGGNTAGNSTGAVQASSVRSSPSAGAGSGTTSASAGAPVVVGGSGEGPKLLSPLTSHRANVTLGRGPLVKALMLIMSHRPCSAKHQHTADNLWACLVSCRCS